MNQPQGTQRGGAAMHLNPKGPLRTQCDSPRPPLVRKATIEPPQNQYTYPIEFFFSAIFFFFFFFLIVFNF